MTQDNSKSYPFCRATAPDNFSIKLPSNDIVPRQELHLRTGHSRKMQRTRTRTCPLLQVHHLQVPLLLLVVVPVTHQVLWTAMSYPSTPSQTQTPLSPILRQQLEEFEQELTILAQQQEAAIREAVVSMVTNPHNEQVQQ